jgi:hypothetical protein
MWSHLYALLLTQLDGFVLVKGTVIGRIKQILMDTQSKAHGVVILEQFDVANERHQTLGMPVLFQGDVNRDHTVIVASTVSPFSIS